eukprot:GHRQ01005839.1.p1 GENE.GHRQ01005839.1~~GHRQ01005839.1.p1  ORF type:complete len:214 (+),score=39.44 GHRQ01005839.1:208-849(+)
MLRGRAHPWRSQSRTQQPFRNTQPCARPRMGQQTVQRVTPLACLAVWDDSMTLSQLRTELNTAVQQEDYALAANLRDTLQKRQTDARLAIEDANERFYAAFRSGNIKEMNTVWGKGDHIQIVHPGSACIAGRELVMESWAAILKGVRPNAFKIGLEDVRVFALSDTQGLVTCLEVMDADDSRGRTVATNLFELQDGKWVMTHHHGSPLMRFTR